MKKTRIVLAIVLAAALLTGCTQSYGTQSTSAPTSGLPQASTLPAEATMNAIRSSFLTQTAAQAHASGGTAAPTNTSAFATVAASPAAATPTGNGYPPAATPAVNTPAAGTAAATTPAGTYPAVPSATPGLPASYTIHEGETAFCIARRFNVDPYELLDLNGKSSEYLAMPDDILKIPTSGKKFPGERALHPHTANMMFTVKAGQTNVFFVACYFGDVDPNAIIFANSLTAPYSVAPGQQLRIP